MSDPITHPPHYQAVCQCPNCGHAIEAIDITERFDFRLGNVLKYVLRAGRKGDAAPDLRKAEWYLRREIAATAAGSRPTAPQGDFSGQPSRESAEAVSELEIRALRSPIAEWRPK